MDETRGNLGSKTNKQNKNGIIDTENKVVAAGGEGLGSIG